MDREALALQPHDSRERQLLRLLRRTSAEADGRPKPGHPGGDAGEGDAMRTLVSHCRSTRFRKVLPAFAGTLAGAAVLGFVLLLLKPVDHQIGASVEDLQLAMANQGGLLSPLAALLPLVAA